MQKVPGGRRLLACPPAPPTHSCHRGCASPGPSAGLVPSHGEGGGRAAHGHSARGAHGPRHCPTNTSTRLLPSLPPGNGPAWGWRRVGTPHPRLDPSECHWPVESCALRTVSVTNVAPMPVLPVGCDSVVRGRNDSWVPMSPPSGFGQGRPPPHRIRSSQREGESWPKATGVKPRGSAMSVAHSASRERVGSLLLTLSPGPRAGGVQDRGSSPGGCLAGDHGQWAGGHHLVAG